jgi:LmbE family N-acetylglucosaminyl deacetylase
MLNTKTILILAPHTDDGEFGCGASIAKYTAEGKQVHYVAFSGCQQSLPAGLPSDTLLNECKKATKILGIQSTKFFDFEVRKFPAQRQEILEEMAKIRRELNPQTVFLPAKNDVHQDHHVIFSEGLRAFKNSNLLGYELPWNNKNFRPGYFEKINAAQLATKQQALRQYKSQQLRKYMNEDFIRSLAVVRGIQCGNDLAEAFEVYHMNSDI